MKQDLPHKPSLGLALSGGGARGLAHIGVLKELARAHIPIDYLAGTSMGGVIGAVYAAGMGLDKIESTALEFAKRRNLIKLVDPTVPRRGVFQGELLHAFFKQFLHDLTFADLNIPLTMVAVDLNSGKEALLCEGNVADAVRATISVPGLFAPVEDSGQRLVDGGLLNNLPTDVVRQMGADIVLAVDVMGDDQNSYWQMLGQKRFLFGQVGGLIAVLGESLDLLFRQQRNYKLHQFPPDFLLQPPIPSEITMMTGFSHTAEIIALGEVVTHPILSDLQETLMPKDVSPFE